LGQKFLSVVGEVRELPLYAVILDGEISVETSNQDTDYGRPEMSKGASMRIETAGERAGY
jgi:hypothetical protein